MIPRLCKWLPTKVLDKLHAGQRDHREGGVIPLQIFDDFPLPQEELTCYKNNTLKFTTYQKSNDTAQVISKIAFSPLCIFAKRDYMII